MTTSIFIMLLTLFGILVIGINELIIKIKLIFFDKEWKRTQEEDKIRLKEYREHKRIVKRKQR